MYNVRMAMYTTLNEGDHYRGGLGGGLGEGFGGSGGISLGDLQNRFIVNYNSTACIYVKGNLNVHKDTHPNEASVRHLLDIRRQGWRFAVSGGLAVWHILYS